MKTIETTVYSANELKAQFPDAFERALKHYQDGCDRSGEIPWQAEIFDSLKGLFEAAGVKLKNYNLGASWNRGNNIDAIFSQDEAGELTGARAFAWIENNILAPLRIPWTGARRWKMARHNLAYVSCGNCRPYSAGLVPPCPFTGYCADESFIDGLLKAVRSGDTLKEAFEGLTSTYATLIEEEMEQERSEETFLDRASDWQFTEDGDQF